MDIKNAKVLITGASRGIGLALAKAFAKKEAALYLVARSDMSSLTSELEALGAPSVHIYSADLTSAEATEKLYLQLKDENIDILVNNAGLLTGGLIEEQNPADIVNMLNVNLTASILLSRYFLPGMLARRRGKIVNNASVSGKMFLPCASTYAASKAGLVAFTESIKQELRGTGVSTLLLITPGVKTEMYDDIYNLYGKHMDLSFLTSIPAEEWSSKVIKAIEEDHDTCMPSGNSRFGVWMAQHMTGFFEKAVGKKFSRA